SQAHEAVLLAIKVLQGIFDRQTAGQIAADTHNGVGFLAGNLQSRFIEYAAHKTLSYATMPDNFTAFDYLSRLAGMKRVDGNLVWIQGDQFDDKHWAKSGQSDAAACAAMAWSCSVDDSTIENHPVAQWNWWIEHGIPN